MMPLEMTFRLLILFIGLVIIFVIGNLLTKILTREEYILQDSPILSFGLGFFAIFSLFFSFNQYLKISLNQTSFLVLTFLLLSVLIILNLVKYGDFSFITKIKTKTGFFDPNKKLFALILILLFVIVLYKSVFFPLISSDSVGMYAHTSKFLWNSGFLPEASSSIYEWSYAYPNTAFISIVSNFFYHLNGQFNDLFFKFLIPFFGALSLILVYKISFLFSKDKNSSWISLALVLSTISFAAVIVQEYTTTIELFFFLLSIYSLLIHLKNKTMSSLIIFSIFLASAIMIKYTFIPFAFFILLSLFLFSDKRHAIYSALISSSLSLIFYLRNIIIYKNPIYPAFFGGANFSEKLFSITSIWAVGKSFSLLQYLHALIPAGIIIILLFVDYLFSNFSDIKHSTSKKVIILSTLLYFLSWLYISAPVVETSSHRHILPAVLIMAVFAGRQIILKIERIPKRFLIYPLVQLVTIGAYYMSFSSSHKYSPELLLVIAISSVLIFLAFLFAFLPKKLKLNLIFLSLIFTSLVFVSFAKSTPLWEFPSEKEIIEKYYDSYPLIQYVNENLPENATLITFGAERYYLERELRIFDEPEFEFILTEKNPELALEMLSNYTNYIIVFKYESEREIFNLSIIHKNIDYLEKLGKLKEIKAINGHVLYEIISSTS